MQTLDEGAPVVEISVSEESQLGGCALDRRARAIERDDHELRERQVDEIRCRLPLGDPIGRDEPLDLHVHVGLVVDVVPEHDAVRESLTGVSVALALRAQPVGAAPGHDVADPRVEVTAAVSPVARRLALGVEGDRRAERRLDDVVGQLVAAMLGEVGDVRPRVVVRDLPRLAYQTLAGPALALERFLRGTDGPRICEGDAQAGSPASTVSTRTANE